MINEDDNETSAKTKVEPLTVTQALVGLGLEESDTSTLQYFDFFTKQIPTTAAYFIHTIQKFDLMTSMYNKEVQRLSSQYVVNENLIKELEERVQTLITEKEKMYIEYDIKEGNPLEEMLACAAELKIDLLVIGQRANRVNHNILAKNLARKAPANALIIPEGAEPVISNILVPIDFSPNSVRALKAAISLHKQLPQPAQITCINVYRVPVRRNFNYDADWEETKKIVASNIEAGFNAFLASYAGEEYEQQIKIALVAKTQPGLAKFIMDYADENKVDFLCLGAKGHSKVHLLLMGSVTEELIDINKTIPTMIVK